LLTEAFTATTVGGTDWEVGVDPSTLEFVSLHPKIYMITIEMRQDSSTTAFRPQLFVTKQSAPIAGNGFSLSSAGVTAGQTTAIDSISNGVFMTAQPGYIYYFSLINNSTGSLAGVSTNFQYVLFFSEVR
jgi:hypothetical protein